MEKRRIFPLIAAAPDASSDRQHPGIATRLRIARRHARLSLRELAARSGMSVGQLSKIETGGRPVTLRHFDVIRKALGVPLAAIFPDGASRYVITRREAIAQRLSQSSSRHESSSAVRLADAFLGKRIEPFCYRNFCAPDDIALSVHDSEHFVFVLKGTL